MSSAQKLAAFEKTIADFEAQGFRKIAALVFETPQGNIAKVTNEAEIAVYQKLSETGISPKVLSTKPLDGMPPSHNMVLEMENLKGRKFDAENPDMSGVTTEQVVTLLKKLHDNGVAHGDFHPGNIAQNADGSLSTFDFGFARLKDNNPARFNLTVEADIETAYKMLRNSVMPDATPQQVAEELKKAALASDYKTLYLKLSVSDEYARQLERSYKGG